MTEGPTGSVLLARHGQTDDNRPPLRFQGWTDTPLNDQGRRQAHELAAQLEGQGIVSIWSSDLIRARETADVVAARLGLEVRPDSRLREGYRGRWEGHLFNEIAREEPELFGEWERAGADWRFPDGESLQEQLDRVSACVADVRAAGRLPALVVCHGGSIRVMLCQQDPRGLDAFHDFQIPNVGVFPL
ncbi:MAG: histidine phosphatase family protein [Solirubrobacteraceae bacterium]